jgi:hypothetical protein
MAIMRQLTFKAMLLQKLNPDIFIHSSSHLNEKEGGLITGGKENV